MKIPTARADLVGISSITRPLRLPTNLGDLLAGSGMPVVLGGPQVTFKADEALEQAPISCAAKASGQCSSSSSPSSGGFGSSELLNSIER